MMYPTKEMQARYLSGKATLPADYNRQSRISEMTAVQPGWTYEPALPTVVNDFVPFTGPGDLPIDATSVTVKPKIPVWLIVVVVYFIWKKK